MKTTPRILNPMHATLRRFCIRYPIGLLGLLFFVASLKAGDFFLRDNDRVVFLGDSITEQRLYTTFIEAYALTRHPQWRLSFRNAGWSGDTAFFRSRCHTDGGALMSGDEATRQKMIDETIERGLGRDVLALKPTVVTIDFGMNDVSVRPDTNLYATFLGCLKKMATLLRDKGARVAFLSPQPVEEKVANLKDVEKNQSLRKFSDGIRAQGHGILRLRESRAAIDSPQ